MPRTAIAQIAKMIGRELQSGVGPSEEALAVGPILAEAGAIKEIVGSLLAEAHRKRPDDRMIEAYAFMLESALGTLRLQASGGDVGADHAIAAVRAALLNFAPSKPNANQIMTGNNCGRASVNHKAVNIMAQPRLATIHLLSPRAFASTATIGLGSPCSNTPSRKACNWASSMGCRVVAIYSFGTLRFGDVNMCTNLPSSESSSRPVVS